MFSSEKNIVQESPIFEHLDPLSPMPSKKAVQPQASVALKKEKVIQKKRDPKSGEPLRKQALIKVSPPEIQKESLFYWKPILWWVQQISEYSSRLKAFLKVMGSETLGKTQEIVNHEKKNTYASDLEWFFSTPALCGYLLLMVFHLGSLYRQPIWDYLQNLPALQISLKSPIWNGGPSWSRDLALLTSLATPKNIFLLENWKDPLLEKISKNPWIKKASIQYQFPKNIKIVAQLRKPCLWVEHEG
ncbi:MAG: FtsQ-type POTRA domain-containing protein, partial [Planctomycetota bacterium]